MSSILAAQAELELRRRRARELEVPLWDWYGPDCDCPPGARRPNGSCPVHKRARAAQRPPGGDWSVYFLEAGRGFGKTESGCQWIRHLAETKGRDGRFALVAPTAADVRDVIVEGPSGILAVSPPWFKPAYAPSKRRLTWANGATALCFSADEPERLRGPNFTDAYVDEIAAWRDPVAWDMLMLGLRLRRGGHEPRAFVTTTPKPLPWLRAIKRLATTIVGKGTTYENRDNLADSFLRQIVTKYEGTRLGRQELEAEDIEDVPGALWSTQLLDALRVPRAEVPELGRVVVAVDPSVSDPGDDPDDDASECGIVAGGMGVVNHPTLGYQAHGYVLGDRSLKAHPAVWARAVVAAYREFAADLVVAEVNNGGAMVAETIRAVDPGVPVKLLHASRGKRTRAEPVAALYEQRRVRHVAGQDFAALEAQMTGWVPGLKSPDRMDALVWLVTELLLEGAALEFGESPWPDWRGS
jgi:phage terminase large subunit-like protein